MPIPLGILAVAGAGGGAGAAYEQIATTILGSSAASVTFSTSGLGATYKHLQIRAVNRNTASNVANWNSMQFNNDTASNYSSHLLYGTGSAAQSDGLANQSYVWLTQTPSAQAPANAFGALVVDILDPFSTTKNKTVRTLGGYRNASEQSIQLNSGNWRNTAAVTSILIFSQGNSFDIGSRFSLYGIRG
jgi:hypothetical protein